MLKNMTYSGESEGIRAISQSHTNLTFTLAVAEKSKQSKGVTDTEILMRFKDPFFLPLRSKD